MQSRTPRFDATAAVTGGIGGFEPAGEQVVFRASL